MEGCRKDCDKFKGMDVKYIFVAIPNNSGSTLIHDTICSSKKVACMRTEGQFLVAKGVMPDSKTLFARRWSVIKDILQNESLYKWDVIKENWHAVWARSGEDKTVMLEKSPPNVMRAEMMEKQFPGSSFVLGIRNPYAFALSTRSKIKKYNVPMIMDHWVACARQQLVNKDKLINKIFIRYEDFCKAPGDYCKLLVDFVPELENVPRPNIKPANARRYHQMTRPYFEKVNAIIKENEDLMDAFGYPIYGTLRELRNSKF